MTRIRASARSWRDDHLAGIVSSADQEVTHRLCTFHRQFHVVFFVTDIIGVADGERPLLTIGDRPDPIAGDSERGEVVANGVGPPITERQIVFAGIALTRWYFGRTARSRRLRPEIVACNSSKAASRDRFKIGSSKSK